MALLTIDDPSSGKQAISIDNHPLLRLGFRPFYLLAAAFAAISVPAWLAKYFGWITDAGNIGLLWHVHEMIFGFALAVVVGFVYTAGRNWTGLWTPRGKALAAIAGVWIAGRIAMLLFDPLLAAAVDLAFLPIAAWPLYKVLKRAGNKRNMFLVGMLALLTALNAAFHAAALGWIKISPLTPLHGAILVIVLIECLIGGRVIPFFTSNAVKGSAPVMNARRDHVTLGLTAAASTAWLFGLPAAAIAAFATAAAIAQATRLAGWKPLCTLRNPLLWVLHLSYAWIPLGFLLLGLAALGVVSSSAAFHVLAIGALGGLIIGMITRTALGHTGRILKAGKAETAMYLLVQAGVVTRFCAALDVAGHRNTALLVTGLCWSAAFILYLAVYGPYLFAARVDGKEG